MDLVGDLLIQQRRRGGDGRDRAGQDGGLLVARRGLGDEGDLARVNAGLLEVEGESRLGLGRRARRGYFLADELLGRGDALDGVNVERLLVAEDGDLPDLGARADRESGGVRAGSDQVHLAGNELVKGRAAAGQDGVGRVEAVLLEDASVDRRPEWDLEDDGPAVSGLQGFELAG